MGCGAWLEYEGQRDSDKAPGFKSDSKAFGNWLAAIVGDESSQRELGAAVEPLTAIQADWLYGPPRWTHPELLERAASEVRARIEARTNRPARAIALYAVCGYGGDPAKELAADLRAVGQMARWAAKRSIAKVALRVDYPDRAAPTGLSRDSIYGAIVDLFREPLMGLGYEEGSKAPPTFTSTSHVVREEIVFSIDEYANRIVMTANARAPLFPGAFEFATDASKPHGGVFSFSSLEELGERLKAVLHALPAVILRARVLSGWAHPIELIRSELRADRTFAFAAAKGADVPDQVFCDVLRIDVDLASAVAENPRIGLRTLQEIATHAEDVIREKAANHTRATPDLLRVLATDASARVRRAVAQNERTPAVSLEQLATDPDLGVRAEAIRNSRLPDGVSAAVERAHAQSEIVAERAHVARTTRDAALFELLMNDPDDGVRAALCRNPRISLALLEHVLDGATHRFRVDLASGPKTSPDVLMILVGDPIEEVRMALVASPHKIATVYEALACDKSSIVRAAAARRIGMPGSALSESAKKILGTLASDADEAVREAAIRALTGPR